MSKRLGGIIGCKDKTSSWHLPFTVCLKKRKNGYARKKKAEEKVELPRTAVSRIIHPPSSPSRLLYVIQQTVSTLLINGQKQSIRFPNTNAQNKSESGPISGTSTDRLTDREERLILSTFELFSINELLFFFF